jgi:hypothetical protein
MPRRNGPIVRPNVDDQYLAPQWGEYKASRDKNIVNPEKPLEKQGNRQRIRQVSRALPQVLSCNRAGRHPYERDPTDMFGLLSVSS